MDSEAKIVARISEKMMDEANKQQKRRIHRVSTHLHRVIEDYLSGVSQFHEHQIGDSFIYGTDAEWCVCCNLAMVTPRIN